MFHFFIIKGVTMAETTEKVFAPKGRLLVKEIEVEEKSVGGVLLPSMGSDPENKAKIGEVVSNGILVDGLHYNRDYSVGTKVYFGKFAGATVQTEFGKYISILESEIVAVESK